MSFLIRVFLDFLKGPKDLLDLDDFLNYMSSNYISFTVIQNNKALRNLPKLIKKGGFYGKVYFKIGLNFLWLIDFWDICPSVYHFKNR